MRGLLDQIEDLPHIVSKSSSVSANYRTGPKEHTWLVSCALASGKALGFGADIVGAGAGFVEDYMASLVGSRAFWWIYR